MDFLWSDFTHKKQQSETRKEMEGRLKKKALRPQWIWVRRSRNVGAEEELQLGPACSPHSHSEMGESGHPHQPHPAPYHLAGQEAGSAADLGSAVSDATEGRVDSREKLQLLERDKTWD